MTLCSAALVIAVVLALLSTLSSAVEPILSNADSSKHADHTKPVKVFILSGQSNMVGRGRISGREPGTLESLVPKYPHLIDYTTGSWSVRKDVVMVWKNFAQKNVSNYLQVGGGTGWDTTNNNPDSISNNNIGPELGFGHVLGHVMDEPVLFIKVGTGNRALGWDFRPPGTKQYSYGNNTYAGYGECPRAWNLEAEYGSKWKCSLQRDFDMEVSNVWWPTRGACVHCTTPRWYAGLQYDRDLENVAQVLENLGSYYPGYRGQGYEIAGFVFWQGHKDIETEAYAKQYQRNLAQYIRRLRHDYKDHPGGSNAKFVLATIAFNGCEMAKWKLNARTIYQAQMAVSGDAGNYQEFVDNVKTVDVRAFWRDASVSPCRDGSHYNCNAQTYYDVGNSLGWAMADLIQNKSRLEEYQC